jgi:AmmeMemoRadiSam system protein B
VPSLWRLPAWEMDMIHTLQDAIQPQSHPILRAPAVAGRFYPAEANELRALVQRLLSNARSRTHATVRGLIAPHAGYLCSGEVAAAAYRALAPAAGPQQHPAAGSSAGSSVRLPVVYLLGPAHWRPVDGIGLPRSASFATPLGKVEIAAEQIAHLLRLGTQYRLNEAAHLPEHGLEVQLPFLQVTLGAFTIVPMLFDDGADPERAAADLVTLLDGRPDDLIVVSSDLSHYHTYQEAIILDNGLLKAIATGDLGAANGGEACGLLPILCLMRVAQHFKWTSHLCAYANSGDTCGTKREVVGYGAVTYTQR